MFDTPQRTKRNDLAIYEDVADQWWSGSERWVRTLKNLVPARMQFFDRIVGDWQSTQVLDLGCGGGFMAEAIAQRGGLVTGIDPAQKAIVAARRHAEDQGLGIRYEVGVAEHLPFGGSTFDAVVCVDVLEHVLDLDRVLSEVRRVVKPGGLFLFDTINRNPLASAVIVFLAESVIGLLPRGAHDPEKFIKPLELREALQKRGFVVGRFIGLAPRGINRRFDLMFGEVPTTAIVYMGYATLAAGQ